jgi:hypothetical protein
VAVAVNVTDAPTQLGFDPEVTAITTDGTNAAFTVIVIELDVTVAGIAHNAFDVNTHVTTFPFVSVVEVNVVLFVPTLTPFTFH